MVNEQSKPGKTFAAVITLLGAFALAAQFIISMHSRQTSLIAAIIRYFGFFTILTNILVTACAAFLWLAPQTAWGKFFSKPMVQTATAVYILVVGLTYNIILRGIWHPEGLARFVDESLHVIMPLLFFLFWLVYSPKSNLSYKVIPWLIYPFLYGLYCIIQGSFSGYYPYPFMDAVKLGYAAVAVNLGALLLVFLLLSLLLVAIGKRIATKSIKAKS